MMPTPADILAGLTAIANGWRSIAVAWHLLLAACLLGLIRGWRPSRHLAGMLMTLPLVSVSALAWAAGNPFNGAVFGALSLAFAGLATRLPAGAIHIGPPILAVPGVLLLVFGWVYPHFLQSGGWAAYLYAAPLGLLPCPTLSAVIGLSLVFNLLDSGRWAIALAGAGVLYGVVGAVGLGVEIDLIMLCGAVWTIVMAARRNDVSLRLAS